MAKLVLLRHGESDDNKENRFGGWIDADLSEITSIQPEINSPAILKKVDIVRQLVNTT